MIATTVLTRNSNFPEVDCWWYLTLMMKHEKVSENGLHYVFPRHYWYRHGVSELSLLTIKLWYVVIKLAFAKRSALPLSHSSSKGYWQRQDRGTRLFDSSAALSPVGYASTWSAGKGKVGKLGKQGQFVKAGLINSGWKLLRYIQWTLAAGKTQGEGECHSSQV